MDLAKQLARQLQVYQNVAGVALGFYVYDYTLTFGREVELIWASRWTLMKFLFLLDRYLVVPNLIVQQLLFGTFGWSPAFSCERLSQVHLYLSTIGILLSEVILSVRLWVMWGNDKRVLAGCLVAYVGRAIFQQYWVEKAFSTNHYDIDVPFHNFKGCIFVAQINYGFVTYLITLVSDIMALVLSLIPTLRILKLGLRSFSRSSLINGVYREGVLFYFYLCAICLGLVIQSANNILLMVPVFVVIRMTLSTRMVLHTRELCTVRLPSTPESISTQSTLV